ncbi:MAG: PASTA domain-containing protein [Bacteroidota bacterium]
MIDKLSKKKILVHFSISIVALALVVFTLVSWLSAFTNHGETVTVPNVKGMKFSELKAFLESKSLNVKISDSSMFLLDKGPGVVIEQDPRPNEFVKEGRTIYVSITRTVPPQVKMPNLIDVSQRQAEAILFSYGLRLGNTIYKPDLAKGAILEMRFNGNLLSAGQSIPKGSKIDLVLGDGVGVTDVAVPDLINLSLEEAVFVLKGSALNVGEVFYDSGKLDSANFYVVEQTPMPGDSVFIKQGESISLKVVYQPKK